MALAPAIIWVGSLDASILAVGNTSGCRQDSHRGCRCRAERRQTSAAHARCDDGTHRQAHGLGWDDAAPPGHIADGRDEEGGRDTRNIVAGGSWNSAMVHGRAAREKRG